MMRVSGAEEAILIADSFIGVEVDGSWGVP
jgi:hypothetical protein